MALIPHAHSWFDRGIEGVFAFVSPDSGPTEPILDVAVPSFGQWKEILRDARTAGGADTIAIARIEAHWQALYEFRLRLADFIESKVDRVKRYRDNRGHDSFDRWLGELERLRATRPAFELGAQGWKDFSRDRWEGGWRSFPSVWPDHTRLPHCHRDVISLVYKQSKHGYESPHLAGTMVHRLMSNADLPLFARVHGPDGMLGVWLLRAENLRGLSPLQIQKKFNLKDLPTHISDVTIPGGTLFSRGRVGPVPGLGDSAGAVQYYLHNRIPAKYFSNTHPLTGVLP